MSDSEFEGGFEPVPTPLKAKRETASARNSRTDSDLDSTHFRDAKTTKATNKRKSSSRNPSKTGSAAAKRRNTREVDLFGLRSDDEEAAVSLPRPLASQLPSSLASKVADGCVIRRAQHDGQFYAEIRVYLTKDALDTRPEHRYTKALVTLKLQLDPDQPEWDLLQKLVKRSKATFFAESKPVFYADK